ncbi:hypothetical protein ACFSUS_16465 [Spirosoma soli]|uniref:HEAT repeat domain-containing protein n=1 Tax=Spirosoma soli TaxID=1770529 RepID=A0ABW5M6P9_9BACT
MSWQEHYENAARNESNTYETVSVENLLAQVGQGQYGAYNMIWYALAERATVHQAGWVLFRVLLRNDVSYLIRCNCAEALLQLLGRTDVLQTLNEAIDLTNGSPTERQPYLTALQKELTARLGSK